MTGREEEARCDCGYVCRGATDDELVDDAQRHAREAHGIDVSREQVLTAAGPDGAARADAPDSDQAVLGQSE